MLLLDLENILAKKKYNHSFSACHMEPRRWGLDPLFSAHWKLTVKDIHCLKNTYGMVVTN